MRRSNFYRISISRLYYFLIVFLTFTLIVVYYKQHKKVDGRIKITTKNAPKIEYSTNYDKVSSKKLFNYEFKIEEQVALLKKRGLLETNDSLRIQVS